MIHGVEAGEKINLRRGEKVKICLSKLRSLGLPWDLKSPVGVEWIGSIGKGGTLMTLRIATHGNQPTNSNPRELKAT